MILGQLLERAAHADGDRIAIADVPRCWTFAEADEAAGRLAACLRDSGVATGDRVGVSLYKSGAGFIAMHAVVRAGAVAVPLDPASPTSRLAEICAVMDIGTVVSHDDRAGAIAELAGSARLSTVIGVGGGVRGVRSIEPDEVGSHDVLAPVAVDPDSPAYVITTSGSTGEPKGIVHTHASALAYAELAASAFDVVPGDRVADIAPHHFDISTFALWCAPYCRAAIVVMPEAHQRLPASLSERMASEEVTIWYSVPFLLDQLVSRGDLAVRDLSKLRLLKLGGEVLSPELIGEFMRLVPSARVVNVYGPAEVNHCTHHFVDDVPTPGAPVPIGRPWSGAEVRVAAIGAAEPGDSSLEEGDLWVAATTMMRGYFGRPELDAERIVERDGRRWFRTGDLVSVDSEGRLLFMGRVDNQVKVRGYRLELEAIEAELERQSGVESAVATVRRTASGGDEIVAGVVVTDDEFDEARAIRTARKVLPGYAVPARMITLNGSFLTGSGKLDRRTLRSKVIEMLEEDR